MALLNGEKRGRREEGGEAVERGRDDRSDRAKSLVRGRGCLKGKVGQREDELLAGMGGSRGFFQEQGDGL